jgi:TPR repeat protein
MSAASESSYGPTGGARAARLGEVWEAANALAAVQMPKDHLGSDIKRSDVSLGSDDAVNGSSLVPLHNRRLVDPVVAPTSPFHRRVVACLCLLIVILTGGTSAVIVFRQLPFAYSWLDHVSSWMQFDRSTPPTRRQDAFPRLRVETSRGASGEPLQLALAIEGSAEGAMLIITNVLAGMEISTGNEVGANRWELLPEDVPYAFVAPPDKFVGSVGLVAELRLANAKIVDRQPVYLEWVPPSPLGSAEKQYNREESAGPNRRVEDDSDREKAAVSSSTPYAPAEVGRQALMSSSSSTVESDPDKRKQAGLSITSSAADEVARQEATASYIRPAESDRETTAAISSSPPPAPEWQERTASSTTRVAADLDRGKAVEMSSSTPPAPAPQEVRPSSSLPFASDPNTNKGAVVPSSPSLAQNQGSREAAMVPPSFSRNTQKQVDQNQPATEPSLPAFAQRQLDTEEIAVLLKRGKDLIAHGDFPAARVILKRAAEANNAEAALALASTYDPFVLRELKVYGFSGDTAMARAWYERARELGSTVAPRRLEMLAKEAR